MPHKTKTSTNGHWKYKTVLDPGIYFGFVYLITCTKTGRKYVGKKQYWSYHKNKKVKEKAWKNYTGSSKELNADIKKHGKTQFEFRVLKEYKTRGWLSYAECNLQHKMDVLTAQLEGTDDRAYYNKSILAIRHVPNCKYHPEECNSVKGKKHGG